MLSVEEHRPVLRRQAARGVTLTAPKNAVTCVMGRNGVGKTSLMRAIVGQQPIRSGDRLGGRGHHAAPTYERRGAYLRAAGPRNFSAADRGGEPADRLRRPAAPAASRSRRHLRTVSRLARHAGPPRRRPLRRSAAATGDRPGARHRPRLLVLDEPTEGIQPSIIKDLERVIRLLVSRGNLAILLVEQYFEFARDLADFYAVMDRGEIVVAGKGHEMVEADVRRHLTV